MPRLATSAAALVALTLAAAPAEGQLLRRIKQAAADRAAEAVGREAGVAPAGASTARAESANEARAARAPLAITAERLDQFLVAMRPAAAYAERRRGEFAARRAYEAQAKTVTAHNAQVEACAGRVMEQERPRLVQLAANPMANQDALQRLQGNHPALGALTEAMVEAANRGDHSRMRVLEDSAAVLKFKAIASVVPALARCGVPKSGPAAPVTAQGREPEELIVPPGGMTRGQFGRLRERVALYALGGDKEQPFTAEERAALDARAADLATLAPLFRDGLLEWSAWDGESALGRAWAAGKAAP